MRIFSLLVVVLGTLLSTARVEAAELQYPLAVAQTPDGTIYLADRLLPGIWKIAPGGKLELFFEASKKFRTPLNAIRCLAVDKQGRLLAGDSSTRDIYRFDDGKTPTPLTKGENAGIGIPMAIAVHSSGEIYVADLEIHRIVKVPEAGGRAVDVAEVPAPRGLWFDAKDQLWIVSHGPDQVLKWTVGGKVEPVVKGRPFNFAHHIAVDGEGMAYIADGYDKTLWKFNGTEVVKLVVGEPLVNPVGVFWTGERLLVVDPRAKGLFFLTKENTLEAIPLAQ